MLSLEETITECLLNCLLNCLPDCLSECPNAAAAATAQGYHETAVTEQSNHTREGSGNWSGIVTMLQKATSSSSCVAQPKR